MIVLMRRFTTISVVVLLAAHSVTAQSTLATTIDAIVEAPIKAGKVAGASLVVARGNQTIVERAYGFADLQLDVPTPPGAIYEIGSVTKQFTAAAMLLLAEDGKLSLDDELTKFLPDYPTAGHRVTVRHLLNHTSGIKGYTELPEFGEFMMLRKPKDELVKLFSSKPFDFPPGEDLIYNNSAFFLLGLIIEKVAGQSYADFVKARLFEKAGMKDSSVLQRADNPEEESARLRHGQWLARAEGLPRSFVAVFGRLALLERTGSAALEPRIAWRQGLVGRVIPSDDDACQVE